jgi:Flp pilus assembly protein TadD
MEMNRILMGLLAAAALPAASVAVLAADEQTNDAPVLSEAHFLTAADDAFKRGDKDGVVQLYQSAIIYAPGDPVPYERLAHYYADNGQAELAQQFYGSALNVQPGYAPALQGLALLALASGNRAGAQAQRDMLVRACGAACPETTRVDKALSDAALTTNGSKP